jgi:hypothetical protein
MMWSISSLDMIGSSEIGGGIGSGWVEDSPWTDPKDGEEVSSGEEVSMMTLGGVLLFENFRPEEEDDEDVFVFLDEDDEFWREYQFLGFF